MKIRHIAALLLLCVFGGTAFGAAFVNGNFELGTAFGWTIGGGSRTSTLNPLDPTNYLPGGANYNATIANTHSAVVTPGGDPRTGGALNRVYSGNYSWRVEDTAFGGYASVLSQQVNNYTDPNIYFAWAAVLEGAHGTTNSATVQIVLTDLSTNTVLISRQYNAASGGGGVDPRFNYNASTNMYWTPWQIEQLSIDSGLLGHNFLLSVLAGDCQPTGHLGYLYLDGFGAVTPPSDGGIPEPATFGLMGLGFAGLGFARVLRRKFCNMR